MKLEQILFSQGFGARKLCRVLIARGAAVFAGGQINQAQLLHIELVSAEIEPKAKAPSK